MTATAAERARSGSTAAWHGCSIDDVAVAVATNPQLGLSADEAARRLADAGPNTLAAVHAVSALVVLGRQFQSVVVWVLAAAAIVSLVVGEHLDGIAILAILVLNAVVGFVQEYRAERAVAALARLTAPRARVVRDGRTAVVPAAELVRGDVLLLEGGDVVAADARLVDATALRTNEAALTGESEVVDKDAGLYPPETVLADRRNLVFLGTSVVAGTGRALVVATGMTTEVGHIAALLETTTRDRTPLEEQLDQVGRRLLALSLAIVGVVFGAGVLRGTPVLELFMSAVSLAVAAIPEGLPAVVTVALALGVQRMARRAALVRRLPAVETLGCTTVICTDKTGTLTVGAMTVRRLVTADDVYELTGEGYGTAGDIRRDGTSSSATTDPVLYDALRAGVACNDAELKGPEGRAGILGDPTEAALLVAGAKVGITRADVMGRCPRLGSQPFDATRKRMSVVCRVDGRDVLFAKGAPEVLAARCTHVRTRRGDEVLTDAERARLLEAGAFLAGDGLRVLALAERVVESSCPDDPETDLTLLGFVGMQDPPRPEARTAVARCRRAGIRLVMITGDHPATARAIASELGILGVTDAVLAGQELEAMDDVALARRVRDVTVYARVTAEHKLRIVRAWRATDAIVAMTGDGVNDAPALKEASVGIAMGITGTEVTKEAADLVIADDNFTSIVAAVEEGRGIYANISKTLAYLVAGNAGELLVMLAAAVVGWPLPLLPIQLLWVNLVTDGLPALALATDPAEPHLLDRPPRKPGGAIMDARFLIRAGLTGALTAAVTLTAFGVELLQGTGTPAARNAAFTVLVFEELLRAFGARSETRIVFETGMRSNLRLLAVVAGTLLLQLALHRVTWLAEAFQVEHVSWGRYAFWLALASVPLTVLELEKLLRRSRRGDGAVSSPTT